MPDESLCADSEKKTPSFELEMLKGRPTGQPDRPHTR